MSRLGFCAVAGAAAAAKTCPQAENSLHWGDTFNLATTEGPRCTSQSTEHSVYWGNITKMSVFVAPSKDNNLPTDFLNRWKLPFFSQENRQEENVAGSGSTE